MCGSRKDDPLEVCCKFGGENMKIWKLSAIMLAICLAGCAFHGAKPEETTIPEQPSASVSRQQTETIDPVTEATRVSESSETDPPVVETTQPQQIAFPEPEDADFVPVLAYIPDIVVDLRYASENNFTGQKIYGFSQVWLRYGTVKKLMQVQEALKERSLGLKIWDGFRPTSVQFKLWEICPDPTYVSNPNNGFSSHSRGNTVDITLTHADGTELTMPTGFDDFSKLADRDYSDCGQEAAENALLLEQIMEKYGFRPYFGEWWHYSDAQTYPVEETFSPVEAARYYAECNEYISLRAKPDASADVITRIPAGWEFQVLAQYGEFFLAEYQGLYGYVLRGYARPVS